MRSTTRWPGWEARPVAPMNSLPPISRFEQIDPENGTRYDISVACPDPDNEPGPWPAILFMDGDDQFRFAAAAYGGARARGLVPPLVLAGVGYGASYTRPGNRRVRDYTPTAVATEPDSGGAAGFLAFLTGTLWRTVAARYPICEDRRGIAGHSLGSLLVLFALFQREPFFSRFLASAPSLWWDDRALLRQAGRMQQSGAALPARLFLAVGEEDTPSMTGDLKLLEDQLASRPFPHLEVISRRFPQRDHYNVLPEAFAGGLQSLFG